MKIRFNDAWKGIPLENADDFLESIQERLQSAHPLKDRKLIACAKRERQEKYLLEDDEDGISVWVLDFGAKRRIKGKTCYFCARIQVQDDFDAMMNKEYEDWVQEMKDAGAWHG